MAEAAAVTTAKNAESYPTEAQHLLCNLLLAKHKHSEDLGREESSLHNMFNTTSLAVVLQLT